MQAFNTYRLLDCRFDHYVAVSDFVSRFLATVYGLTTPIIPPFIDIDSFPAASPWWSRPAGSTLVYVKGEPAVFAPIINRLRSILSSRAPDIRIDNILSGIELPQTELLAHIGSHRHLLALSPAEGFGLVPLEAMAMGTTVLGFDGFGGRDFMRPGVNCATAAYPDIESVADSLIRLTRAPELGAQLAQAGRATAQDYTYARFRAAWIAEFNRFLAVEAV